MDWMSSAALDDVEEDQHDRQALELASRRGEVLQVTVEQRKKSDESVCSTWKGWRGTPAESRVDLDNLQTASVVFEGQG
ncbi:unnamed protein product [Symbiodinium natans]|uniref:Uncharacterized protein n=1 Tax=Symbiodinium natans TaxID=878477 RepID=A0A812V684_9DINO|nr:unnamed protein product [Symbiodinium natans]